MKTAFLKHQNGSRITSYNVCYTKLLRTPPQRHHGGHLDHRLPLAGDGVDRRLVERHRADAGRGLVDDRGADLVDRPAGRQISYNFV